MPRKPAQPFKPNAVWQAITKARSIYRDTGFATHDVVDVCEDWVNSSPNVDPEHIETFIQSGELKRSPTSGRLFIQLSQEIRP